MKPYKQHIEKMEQVLGKDLSLISSGESFKFKLLADAHTALNVLPQNQIDAFSKLFFKGKLGKYYKQVQQPSNISYFFSVEESRNKLLWLYRLFNFNKQELEDFLYYKEIFDSCFFAEDYYTALCALDEFEDSYGNSLWLWDSRLSCAYAMCDDSNVEEYVKTLEPLIVGELEQIVVTGISYRNTESYQDFVSGIKLGLDKNEKPIRSLVASFLLPFEVDTERVVKECPLIILSMTSVDQYLLAKDVIRTHLSSTAPDPYYVQFVNRMNILFPGHWKWTPMDSLDVSYEDIETYGHVFREYVYGNYEQVIQDVKVLYDCNIKCEAFIDIVARCYVYLDVRNVSDTFGTSRFSRLISHFINLMSLNNLLQESFSQVQYELAKHHQQEWTKIVAIQLYSVFPYYYRKEARSLSQYQAFSETFLTPKQKALSSSDYERGVFYNTTNSLLNINSFSSQIPDSRKQKYKFVASHDSDAKKKLKSLLRGGIIFYNKKY